jgi:hypothetical protein
MVDKMLGRERWRNDEYHSKERNSAAVHDYTVGIYE